ncbi:YczE/YyaS/YitT family protein [Corynebacterium sp. H113]|uniref:YczE/YyaS/YitT family protein n=1 Tax=Corynebacterium sp. H113 TaxID=3133419 RepID=UPI0030A80C5D
MTVNNFKKMVFSAIGLVFMALGITTATMSGLGTTPISAPVWVATLAGGLSFGGWTLALNALLFLLQLVLLRGNFPASSWWQLPAMLVFSAALDMWVWILGEIHFTEYWQQFVQLILGLVILGIGIAIEVSPNFLFVPGEGLVATIALLLKKPFHKVKIANDITLVTIALIMSFVFFGEVRGLREGTAIAAVLTGVVVGAVAPTVDKALGKLLAIRS